MDADEKNRARRNLQTVETYFRLLRERDLDSWLTLWARDGVQLTPLVRDGMPTIVMGRSRIESSYRARFSDYSDFDITDLRVDSFDGPDRVLARWHTRAELAAGGRSDNDHVGLFEFDETGAIALLTLVDLFEETQR